MYRILKGSFGTNGIGSGLLNEKEIEVRQYFDIPAEASYYDATNGVWIKKFTTIDNRETLPQ